MWPLQHNMVSLDLEVPFTATGQKGAVCRASEHKEERPLPHTDRKPIGGCMICRAWLYQTEIDGQGQTGLWGKVALLQQAALEW